MKKVIQCDPDFEVFVSQCGRLMNGLPDSTAEVKKLNLHARYSAEGHLVAVCVDHLVPRQRALPHGPDSGGESALPPSLDCGVLAL